MESVLLNQNVQPINSHTMLHVLLYAQVVHTPATEDVSEAVQLDRSTSEDGVMILAQYKLNTLPTMLVLLLAQQVLHLSITSVLQSYDLTL